MKALQIYREICKIHPECHQITHERNTAEIARLGLPNVLFVKDTAVSVFFWRSVVLRLFVDVWFSWKATRLARDLAAQIGHGPAVVWQTEPNSPVARRSLTPGAVNVFGPINGNIYYPAAFRDREKLSVTVRRLAHMPLQRINRLLPGGIKRAEQILVAGGDRTRVSLEAAGCPANIMVDTVDCGIPDNMLDRTRVTHQGQNHRFIHFGRLVFHKGTELIIKAMVKTQEPVTLDIVGRGPELEACKALVQSLGLQTRVNFLDWYTRHEDLFASFAQYRGMLLPSLEDANGIVVQEAMAQGLPPICLDWGGPSLLIKDGRTGFLVQAGSIESITDGLAAAMDRLARDGELAERMSVAGRQDAEGWRWTAVARDWLSKVLAAPER